MAETLFYTDTEVGSTANHEIGSSKEPSNDGYRGRTKGSPIMPENFDISI